MFVGQARWGGGEDVGIGTWIMAVDGSEIRQTHQLSLVVEIPLFTVLLYIPISYCRPVTKLPRLNWKCLLVNFLHPRW